ncbi:hypothetical protein ACFSS8_18770 [Paracoccus kondratievae]
MARSKNRSEKDGPAEPETAKVLQKRQLMTQVARRTGLRNSDVKTVVEATLAELGDAMALGMTLALPPWGGPGSAGATTAQEARSSPCAFAVACRAPIKTVRTSAAHEFFAGILLQLAHAAAI